MAEAGRFDPNGYLAFDLARGTLRTARPDGQAIVLPPDAMAKLASAGATVVGALGRALGEAIGARVRAGLAASGDPSSASPEAFLAEANGQFAVHGMGRFAVETIGEVLVVRPEGIPLGDGPGLAFLEAVFSSMLGAFMNQPVRVIAVPGPKGPAVLLAGAAAIERATAWVREGAAVETIALRLHREARGIPEESR